MRKVEKVAKPKPYMPWFIMDFERDTGHLSLEECEAYRRLLEAQWKRDARPLPDDDVVLARLIRVELETWKRLRPAMEHFYDLSTGVWSHPRVVEIWLWVMGQMEAASEHGRKGAAGRWGGVPEDMPEHMPEEMPEEWHSKPHSHSKPIPKPEPQAKAIDNVVSSALEGGDLEECMRRTRELVGEKEMAGRKYGFWKTLYLDCTPAYRDALTDAESRKKEAAHGLPEAQIKKTWAHYLTYQFKEFKKAYAN